MLHFIQSAFGLGVLSCISSAFTHASGHILAPISFTFAPCSWGRFFFFFFLLHHGGLFFYLFHFPFSLSFLYRAVRYLVGNLHCEYECMESNPGWMGMVAGMGTFLGLFFYFIILASIITLLPSCHRSHAKICACFLREYYERPLCLSAIFR